MIYGYISDKFKNNESLGYMTWDYWHLANKKVLEYIVNNDHAKEIKIYYFYDPFEKTCNYAWILPEHWQRKRLIFVKNPLKADYLLSASPDDALEKVFEE